MLLGGFIFRCLTVTIPPSEVTLEELSHILAEQTKGQDRCSLVEKCIVNQVNYRESLLLEERTVKDDRIQVLEQHLTESRQKPESVKSLDTPTFIL